MGISSALGSQALLPAGLGFRNMVINGNFVIDQRNNGVAQSGKTTDFYAVDRFVCSVNTSGNYTGQQVALSTLSGTQPAGFTHALGCTAASGRTAAAGDVYGLRHRIEGFNSAQLSWGSTNAKTATLSFWVRSSVVGTYNVGLFNASANRSLVTSYTINTANTWEYKTIFIVGDASGTWGIGNGVGVEIFWDLGTGSTYNASSLNTWSAGIFVTSASSVKWIATSNATFYITGVQFESNTQPTPFEQRPIGIELQLCQRYYEKSFDYSTAPQNGIYSNSYISNVPYLDYWVLAMQWIEFKVEKLRVPDMSFWGDGGKWQANNSNNTWTTFAQAPTSAVQGVTGLRTSGFGFGIHNNGANGFNVVGYSRMVRGDWVANAEL
jgi:hypothetical protein